MHLHLKRKIADRNDAILYGTMVKCFPRAHRVVALLELATCLGAQATLQTRALLAALRAEVCKTTEVGHCIAGRWTAGISPPARPSHAAVSTLEKIPRFWQARSHITSHVA